MPVFGSPPQRQEYVPSELGKLALDAFESSVLDVARNVFETFERPDEQCWMDAFWQAEQAFPPPFGATIAHAVVIAISAVRSVRDRPFAYIPTMDPAAETALTDEERYFMMTLRAIRKGDRTTAQANAMLLCDGGDCRQFLKAFERLCIIIGEGNA